MASGRGGVGATGGNVTLHHENDPPDDRLINRLSKWVMYNRLPQLAVRLGFTMPEITRIIIPSRTQRSRRSR